MENYEKHPRKMRKEEQKEVIHLLPIKDKSRIIPQSMEKPGERRSSAGRVTGWLVVSIRSVTPL